MKIRILIACCALVITSPSSVAMLTATNIIGTDGSPSLFNQGNPEQPLIITNIVGLAPTDPSTPGDNLIIGGRNRTPDLLVEDSYFQAGAVAGPIHATTNPPASSISAQLLLEATSSGTVGVDTISWTIDAVRNYDGLGTPTIETATITQIAPSIDVFDVTLSVTGDVVEGDKFIVHNSGVTNWALNARVDVNGDGNTVRSVNIESEDFLSISGSDTNTSEDFNNATVTFLAYEIQNGEFVSGQFDVTFDQVVPGVQTFPGGDRFDVVPEPTSLALFAIPALVLTRRR